MTHTPRVSIGLPVHNGENFVADALDSILAQHYRDFEIVICDNASTDGTADICRNYASRDARIEYHRNEHDIGPCLNFNRTLDLARGEFFKWAAHDDLLDPEFIGKCVAVLDAEPETILVHSLTRIIDDEGKELAIYDSKLRGALSARQSRRFAALILNQHICTEMFGLHRSEALRRSARLSGNYHGCDRAMLGELALIGPFAHIPEPLFMNREHGARYVRAVKPGERVEHHHESSQRRIALNTWRLYRDYRSALRRHGETGGDRLRGALHLLTWWFVGWNFMRVGAELVAQVYPGFYDLAKGVKNRYIRPAHPLHGKRQDDRE